MFEHRISSVCPAFHFNLKLDGVPSNFETYQ